MQLREERQQILTQAAMRKDVKDRIEDLATFLDEQTEAVTEYSDTLVRRLIERIIRNYHLRQSDNVPAVFFALGDEIRTVF